MDFKLARGTDKTFFIDVSLDGVPLDLTGYTIKLLAKRSPADADVSAWFAKSIGSGLSLEHGPGSAVNNRIRVVISPVNTASLPDKLTPLYFDCKVKGQDGLVHRVADGTIVVSPDITRSI